MDKIKKTITVCLDRPDWGLVSCWSPWGFMSVKIPCKECSALILPSTGERTGGLCMPCKNGI